MFQDQSAGSYYFVGLFQILDLLANVMLIAAQFTASLLGGEWLWQPSSD